MGTRQRLLELKEEKRKQRLETGCCCYCWSGLGSLAYGKEHEQFEEHGKTFPQGQSDFCCDRLHTGLGGGCTRSPLSQEVNLQGSQTKFGNVEAISLLLCPSGNAVASISEATRPQTKNNYMCVFFRFQPFEKDRLKKTVPHRSVSVSGRFFRSFFCVR